MTPLMQQYFSIKEQYPDCILFFRLGDFYEMFFEDAEKVSTAIDIVLTKRGETPMCGVPFHTSEIYLARLVNAGFKVAVCEQLTEAGTGKMVERGVVRVITAGTVNDLDILEKDKNNFIMSIFAKENEVSVCYCDITTGEFCVQSFKENIESQLTDCLNRVLPKEVITNQKSKEFYQSLPLLRTGIIPQPSLYFEWAFSKDRCVQNLKKQFGDNFEKVFEMQNQNTLQIAGGALLEYLFETQKRKMKNISQIQVVKNQDYLVIDSNSRRNLELCENSRERKKTGSLLWILDKTKTSMGARQLKKIFDQPLTNSKEINQRLKFVEELFGKVVLRDNLSQSLAKINDIERISGKIAYGTVMPKELVSMKNSLMTLPSFKDALSSSKVFEDFAKQIPDFSQVQHLLERGISNEPPTLLKDGGYIKEGFNSELDSLREISKNAENKRIQLQEQERLNTGISNLKVAYNRVIGFYIEVNKRDIEKVPLYYIRKQTISNNERYTTEELTSLSTKVLTAKEDAVKLESHLYSILKESLQDYVADFQKTARLVGFVDCMLSLATVAVKNNFVKPVINSSINHIKIIEGRHPVVEHYQKSNTFIANDTYLNSTDDRMMIITGPNMSGKSTYMRQVALITFMAHIGSFVPCKSAEISICDRIFTRVGASDDLAFGQSTFMVEMSEVATILARATEKSLVILDEIGRGTSTFDGLSIAWAVVEHISKNIKSKTLFATHYHELTDLEGVLEGVKNYKVAVKEFDDRVIFLHKILRGGTNKSFGIEVARLALVPSCVIERSKQISQKLEKINQKLDIDILKEDKSKAQAQNKKALEILSIVKDIDINRVSPMSAFDILLDLVNKTKEGNDEN